MYQIPTGSNRFLFIKTFQTFQLTATRFYGLTCDESKVQENIVLLEKVLNVYDKILADNKYFCGKDFSLADLFHIPNAIFVRRLKGFQEIFGRYPNFSRWLKLCEQREAWGKALEDTKGMERKE